MPAAGAGRWVPGSFTCSAVGCLPISVSLGSLEAYPVLCKYSWVGAAQRGVTSAFPVASLGSGEEPGSVGNGTTSETGGLSILPGLDCSAAGCAVPTCLGSERLPRIFPSLSFCICLFKSRPEYLSSAGGDSLQCSVRSGKDSLRVWKAVSL